MFYQVSVPGNNVYVLFNFLKNISFLYLNFLSSHRTRKQCLCFIYFFKKYILFVFKFLIKSAYQETMFMFYLIFKNLYPFCI